MLRIRGKAESVFGRVCGGGTDGHEHFTNVGNGTYDSKLRLPIMEKLAGNDDAGQMSTWYIFSAMGFYPVCPETPYYAIASPTFKHLKIRLENGKLFRMDAPEASEKNIYIQSVELDGREYTKNYILHDTILKGGHFVFHMGATPNPLWGNMKK